MADKTWKMNNAEGVQNTGRDNAGLFIFRQVGNPARPTKNFYWEAVEVATVRYIVVMEARRFQCEVSGSIGLIWRGNSQSGKPPKHDAIS